MAFRDTGTRPSTTAHGQGLQGDDRGPLAAVGRIHSSLPASFFVVILEGQHGDPEASLIRASVDPQIIDATPELAEYLREIETE